LVCFWLKYIFGFTLILVLGEAVCNLTPASIGDATSNNGNPAILAVDGNNSTIWEQIGVGDRYSI